MQPNRMILLIGSRNTGKTCLLKDLLYNTRANYDMVVLFTPTHSTVAMFAGIIPSNLIFREYNAETMKSIIDEAKHLVEEKKPRRIAIVLDDLVYDSSFLKSTLMREIALNGRHFYVTLFLTTQYTSAIPVLIRSNIDYVFSMKEMNAANVKRLYESYYSVFPSLSDFRKVLDACTNEYGTIVFDRTKSTQNITESIFWYRSNPKLPMFKLCKPVYHKLNELARDASKKKVAHPGVKEIEF